MKEKVLLDNWQVKATKYGSFVLISAEELLLEPERFECDKNTKDFNCAIVMLYPEEIDAIHASLHAGDEPEPENEERTCGNCGFGKQWAYSDYHIDCRANPGPLVSERADNPACRHWRAR